MDTGNAERLTEPDWAAFIAIDWAVQKHDWAMEVPGQSKRERGQMAHTPEVIDTWVTQLRQRFADRPIAVTLEQSRGALLFALSKYANLVLYPLHPGTVSSFRQAMYPSGSKNDPLDADVQIELLVKHRDRLQVWKPDTQETRLLQFLVEDRRRRVDQRTGLLNQLTGRLKLYFPQILRWFPTSDSILMWQFLEHWPDLQSAQKASRQKLKAFWQETPDPVRPTSTNSSDRCAKPYRRQRIARWWRVQRCSCRSSYANCRFSEPLLKNTISRSKPSPKSTPIFRS